MQEKFRHFLNEFQTGMTKIEGYVDVSVDQRDLAR